ncbi:MAG: penicillin-binding protein activator [Gammaproteobacteria bacterium]|nr:penicillin-binding protein activator [Gammaproteobacteria bacterium]
MPKSLRQLGLVLLLMLTLSSCSQLNTGSNQPTLLSAGQYQQLASNSSGAEQQRYQLLAAKRLLQDHKTEQAGQALEQLPQALLTPALVVERKLLTAQLELAENRPNDALFMLSALPNNLTDLQRRQSLQLTANAYQQQGNTLASISAREDLARLLPNQAERRNNLLTIWQSLQHLELNQLRGLASQTTAADLLGWLSLALDYKQTHNNTALLLTRLAIWRTQYPNHPANALLPNTIPKPAEVKTPQNITLLLPLSGRLAKIGDAIRNGFMAAYYAQKNTQLDINIINTAQSDVVTQYRQAEASGSDFIVGPLTKNNIRRLLDANVINVPTLALNTVSGKNNNPNLFQFGLSPEDEAYQVALKAWQDGHRRSLIIVPKSNWGQAVAARFSKEWQTQGGAVVDQYNYHQASQLATGIRHLLRIDQSYARERQLKNLFHQHLRFIPERRHDFDMIFLVASPKLARQIQPLLKFYYAGNVAVFATSKIYRGNPKARTNKDLNGVIFPDMPWVSGKLLQPNSLNLIRQTLSKTWPHSFARNRKLYALGVDSFYLINKLNQLSIAPQLGINAATGTLFLTNQQHLYRQLQWLQMQHGSAKVIQ